MDELQALFESFTEALRSLAEVPREVAAEMKRWGAAVSAAATQMATIPTAIGGKLTAAADAFTDFMRRNSRALDPVFNRLVAVFQSASNTLSTVAAPLVSELKLLASAAAGAGRFLQSVVLPSVVADMRALAAAIAPVVAGFTRLASSAISTTFAALPPVLGAVQSGFLALGSGLRGLTGLLTTATTGALSTAFRGLTAIAGGLASALGIAGKGLISLATNPAANLAGAFSKAAAPTAGIASGLGGALSGIAGSVMGPLQGLAGAVGPFVAALNPNLMRLFNQALRDLMATFGAAFAPIIQHVAALFNELSATLAPAMRALAPILDNLASVMEGTLVPIIGMIADAFVALAPVIEFVTSLMASVAEAMRVVYTVFRSAIQVFFDVVKQLFGGVDLKGAADGLREVLQTLTKYFVQFAAYVAKALGYINPFADALKKNLRDLEGKTPGVKAAPENIHVSGLEQISKDLAVAAYSAAGAGGKRKSQEAEFLEQLIKEVEAVKQNSKTLEQFLTEMKDKIVEGVMNDLSQLWDMFVQWWATNNPVASAQTISKESERHRQLEEQAQEMRRRHGMSEPSRQDPGFWANLWNQP